MPKTLEQLKQQFLWKQCEQKEDSKRFEVYENDGELVADYWLSIIQAEREEFQKTLNSGRKMYELGKKEAREELRSKVEGAWPGFLNATEPEDDYQRGWNEALTWYKANLEQAVLDLLPPKQ